MLVFETRLWISHTDHSKDDDPYYTEISHFIDNVSQPFPASNPPPISLSSLYSASLSTYLSIPGRWQVPIAKTDLYIQIEGGPEPDILCGYLDAAKTYEMTWRIRLSSEESTRKTLERAKAKAA